MQYTGLKDKNGKEIYEGDIVEMSPEGGYSKGSFPVCFIDGAFGVRIKESGDMFNSFCYDTPPNIKIIGNVFDNPELLNDR